MAVVRNFVVVALCVESGTLGSDGFSEDTVSTKVT
jgi:hypothetical protein